MYSYRSHLHKRNDDFGSAGLRAAPPSHYQSRHFIDTPGSKSAEMMIEGMDIGKM